MSILYTKTYDSGNGSYLTDLMSSAGKDWGASYWIANGIYSTGRPPCFSNYRGDVYIIGCFSRVLYRPRQDRRFLPAGIVAPRKKLAVVEAAGSGGSTGAALAFVTLLHKEGALVLAESDRSNVVDIGTVSGGGFAWSNLPTNNEEFRVTHIRGYRSMDGDDYRMAWESPYGISTFTENVLTQHRTILAPAWKRNGIPPKGLHYGTDWAGRMFYARTSEHPYRLWWSPPGDPQYVGQTSYLDTWDRSTITCIAKAHNELIVFTLRNAYLVRQFGQEASSDFVLVKLDSSVGCISHFGAIEIHNRLWFPSEDGVWIYDGGFHYVMRDMRPYWVSDFKANKSAFLGGHAFNDRDQKTYVYTTGRSPAQIFEGFTCGTVGYVGTYEMYEPSIAGIDAQPQPDWTIDAFGRRNSSAHYNADGEVLIGSCDGQIRKFSDTDPDDDGDSVRKALVIRHGLNVLNEPGDDVESGKQLSDFWCYVEAETGPWTMYLMGGDEHTWRSVRPDNVWQFWKVDVAASFSEYAKKLGAVTKTLKATPKTVHYFGQPPRVSGRGYVLEIQASSPVGVKYRGHGGSYSPGAAGRPFEDFTNFDLTVEWRKQGDVTWETGPVSVIDLTDPNPPSVTIEFRATVAYQYGTISYPVGLTYAFTGSNLPEDDVTDQIVTPNSEKITAIVFTGVDTAAASGAVVVTAVDANGVEQNASVQLAVSVSTHFAELENQVNSGGWDTTWPVTGVGGGDVVEIRTVVSGSRYDVQVTELHHAVHAPGSPLLVSAAGNYLTWTIPYPGAGTKSVQMWTQDAPGGVPGTSLVSENQQIQWV